MEKSKYNLRNVASRVEDLHSSVNQELSQLRCEIMGVQSQATGDSQKTTQCGNSSSVDINYDIIIKKIDSLQTKLNSEIENIKRDMEKILHPLSEAVESCTQKLNSKSIVLYGLEDKNNNIYDSVSELFTSKIGCAVNSKSDISACYRIGKNVSGKPRPIVIEFVRKWKRDEVFSQKSKLKGMKIMMVELLTKTRLEWFSIIRKKFGKNCWTFNGEIYVILNDKKVHVRDKTVLEQVLSA